jgi:glycosyltransferase involved in cell wall biosynthesis
MIKINLLLASFNGVQYLQAQIQSIVEQEYVHVSLFIADDGSTDGSIHAIEALKATGAIKQIYFIKTVPNQGAAKVFLYLLATAISHSNVTDEDLFSFCDQDDVWYNDKLIKANSAIEIFDQQLPVLYGGRTRLVSFDLKHIGYSPLFKRLPSFKNALVQSLMGGNTMVFNYAAAKLIAPDSSQLPNASMHDWWAYQIVSGAGGVVIYDETPFIGYRQHSNNVLGANAGFVSRVRRFIRLMRGEYKRVNYINMSALQSRKHLLSLENQQALNYYLLASNSNQLKIKFKYMKLSEVYRQTFSQNMMLWLACFLKKL